VKRVGEGRREEMEEEEGKRTEAAVVVVSVSVGRERVEDGVNFRGKRISHQLYL